MTPGVAREVETLAEILFEEMWVDERTWDKLPDAERKLFCAVIERLLAEEDLLQSIFEKREIEL